jgi:hypothetical protein
MYAGSSVRNDQQQHGHDVPKRRFHERPSEFTARDKDVTPKREGLDFKVRLCSVAARDHLRQVGEEDPVRRLPLQ